MPILEETFVALQSAATTQKNANLLRQISELLPKFIGEQLKDITKNGTLQTVQMTPTVTETATRVLFEIPNATWSAYPRVYVSGYGELFVSSKMISWRDEPPIIISSLEDLMTRGYLKTTVDALSDPEHAALMSRMMCV